MSPPEVCLFEKSNTLWA